MLIEVCNTLVIDRRLKITNTVLKTVKQGSIFRAFLKKGKL